MRIMQNTGFIKKPHSREKHHEIYGDSKENRSYKKIIDFYKNLSANAGISTHAHDRTYATVQPSPLNPIYTEVVAMVLALIDLGATV